MNKEQTVEFVAFLKEHLFHSSYREDRDRPGVEAMFDALPGEEFELKLPNPNYPEYPIITQEKRIKFKPLYEAIYAEARSDGCIWVPFEETSPKRKATMAEKAENAAESERTLTQGKHNNVQS